jgi:branched-chain amino acid transport system permease protein
MNWQLLPQFAITGFLNGGPIALIALGIVLIFKSSEIFNFAHGQMLLIGTMATWWFAAEEGLNLPLWLAIILALVVSTLLGLLIERFTLRPMTGQPLLSIILMTLALSQVLHGATILTFGTTQRNFPVIFSVTDPYRITLPFQYDGNRIAVILRQNLVWSFVIAMISVALLWVLFQYTRIGLTMRATAEDHETAQSVGIRINRVFGISWAIAGVIATIGGILIATASGLDLSLPIVVLAAFPAVLLGGLESVPGAVVGGLVIGLAQGLVALPNNDFIFGPEAAQAVRNSTEIVPYLILLIVLLIRPDGLFGQKRIERI